MSTPVAQASPGSSAAPSAATGHRHVFVGGLHRSGTTLIAKAIAQHSLVSGFERTGATEDEGQFLQSVYPVVGAPARLYPWADWSGIPHRYNRFRYMPGRFGRDWRMFPGRFSFDPNAHLTESSSLVTPANRERLFDDWAPYWDRSRPVLLEKTPENLIRGRFLQAMFPGATLIMVVRHPLPVSFATQKWSRTSLRSLLRHWLRAHRILREDAPHLERLLVVPYERFVANPDAELARIAEFVGVQPERCTVAVRPDVNRWYFETWERRRRNPLTALYARMLAREFEGGIREFGYSLRSPRAMDWSPLDALQGARADATGVGA